MLQGQESTSLPFPSFPSFLLSTGANGLVCGWPSLTSAARTDQLQLCTQAPSCPPGSQFLSSSSFIPRQKASSCLPHLWLCWATSTYKPWSMTHGKWLDDLPVRFGSCCLRPTGVTQPPLVDYIFPLMDCLLIHMFVDHFHGAKQCSNEFLCAKAKPSDLFTRMTELQTNVQI